MPLFQSHKRQYQCRNQCDDPSKRNRTDAPDLCGRAGVSPETYTGYDLARGFESPGGGRLNKSHVYEYPIRLALNHWALQGDWRVGREAVALNSPDGRIAYHFHTRDIHLVMGPAVRGLSVPFRVLIEDIRRARLMAVTLTTKAMVQSPNSASIS